VVNRRIVAFVLLGLYLAGSVHVLRVVDASTADALVSEDGLFEFLGAGCLLLGAAFALMALLRLRSNPDVGRLKRLSYLGLALFLFLAAGEELSWGQRLLGFETPEAVRNINAQEETNLHNLGGGANGQNFSGLVYTAFWMSFGVLVPFAALLPRVGGLVGRHLLVVPLWLAILFVGQQLLWKPIRAEWRADPGAWNASYRAKIGEEGPFRVKTLAEARARGVTSPGGLGEIMEANVQVLLGAGALCLLLGARRRSGATSGRGPSASPRHEHSA